MNGTYYEAYDSGEDEDDDDAALSSNDDEDSEDEDDEDQAEGVEVGATQGPVNYALDYTLDFLGE